MNDLHLVKKNTTSVFLKGFILGSFGLSAFYYLLLFAVTQDPLHPINQFNILQPWMSLLIIGFGIQMGLFWLMKNGIQFNLQEKKDAKLAAGTGTAVSGMAMVACCAHHLVDVLPILGFSAAALFLSEYQEQLLIFGVLSNLLGIIMMSWFITGKAKPRVILSFINTKVRKTL